MLEMLSVFSPPCLLFDSLDLDEEARRIRLLNTLCAFFGQQPPQVPPQTAHHYKFHPLQRDEEVRPSLIVKKAGCDRTSPKQQEVPDLPLDNLQKEGHDRGLLQDDSYSGALKHRTPLTLSSSLQQTDQRDDVDEYPLPETITPELALTEASHEPLADALTKCPPFADPSSVRIEDQVSLEFELEEGPEKESTVRFHETVSVTPIPSWEDMDEETRDRIWTSIDELERNAQRSQLEFLDDGWNWKLATEEKDMIYDHVTGQLLHPTTWVELQIERRIMAEAMADTKENINESAQIATETITEHRRRRSKEKTSPRKRRTKHYDFRYSPSAKPSLTRFADT